MYSLTFPQRLQLPFELVAALAELVEHALELGRVLAQLLELLVARERRRVFVEALTAAQGIKVSPFSSIFLRLHFVSLSALSG